MPEIAFCICGSFCNHKKTLAVLEQLVAAGCAVTPVLSENAVSFDTRFGRAADFVNSVETLTGREIICDIATAEAKITGSGCRGAIICPCTGNTLAKLRHGVTDTSVTMAAKCLLRNDKPIVIALAALRNRKCFTFVPMSPDDPEKKPNSMICDFTSVKETADTVFA